MEKLQQSKRKKILFIGGSLNQTTMMHKIASYLFSSYDCVFTPFYGTPFIESLRKFHILDFSILGGKHRKNTLKYLSDNDLPVDICGTSNDYDMVVTCTDLFIQPNILDKKMILVQEGMVAPETIMYHLVKYLKLPRFLANTAATGLSDVYDVFCVASNGFKELFIKKGVNPDKLVVTGIPNFDNIHEFTENDFPHKNFVLVATSNTRETFQQDNRMKFLKNAVRIANGRQMIIRLHPNEIVDRAVNEIRQVAPDALIYTSGNTEHMVANCDVLVTQYSSLTLTGLALGKEVHSYLDVESLRKLIPVQNGGKSAERIAQICRQVLQTPKQNIPKLKKKFQIKTTRSRVESV